MSVHFLAAVVIMPLEKLRSNKLANKHNRVDCQKMYNHLLFLL